MKIAALQLELEKIYRLDRQPSIEHFLISSRELHQVLPTASEHRPQVLFRENDEGVELAVHIDEAVLKRVEDEGEAMKSLQDFVSVAEEVSHYLYLIYRASNEQQVTLVDVELQGDIDKFLLASRFFSKEEDLFAALFEKIQFDENLTAEEQARYREAHQLAERFCEAMVHPGENPQNLPQFYRWACKKRRSHILNLGRNL